MTFFSIFFLAPIILMVGLIVWVWWRKGSYSFFSWRLGIHRRVNDFICDKRGQDIMEYALMVGFIAMVILAIMPTSFLKIFWDDVSERTSGIVGAVSVVGAIGFLGIMVMRWQKED